MFGIGLPEFIILIIILLPVILYFIFKKRNKAPQGTKIARTTNIRKEGIETKLCPNCEHDNDGDALFCVECGNKLKWEMKQQVEPSLASIGGWLGYFIILGLFIANPIITVIDISEIFKIKPLLETWFFSTLMIIDVGLLILSIYVGVILLMKKRYAPLWAKILLAIHIAIGIFGLFSGDPQDKPESARTIIVSAIWFAYFFKSKRVKAVYFPEKVELVYKPLKTL